MDFDNGEATFLQASSSRIPLSFAFFLKNIEGRDE
jgi:hypothetical protein